MPASTSTSNVLALLLLLSAPASAATSRTDQPEEDDFSNTPFTEYGEFHEDMTEEENAKFFQHGRFFGASIGMGYQGVSGNRGLLWQGGFPLVDLKVHYWFDFQFALQMQFLQTSHSYVTGGAAVDVSFNRIGLDVKYYFDTRNLSSTISFASPNVLIGFGGFNKTESSTSFDTPDKATTYGATVGAGLEFTIKPRSSYFAIESKLHLARFSDVGSTKFQTEYQIANLEGLFYTFSASVMFTW